MLLHAPFYALQALLNLPPNFVGQAVAHLGVAVTIVGITMVSTGGVEKHLSMAPGDAVEIGGYEFRFDTSRDAVGPNYAGTEARFTVRHNGRQVAMLTAQKRHYSVRNATMTEAGIEAGLTRDLYVALGEPLDGGAWSVRVSVKPFVRWLWLGAILMGLGGVIAVCDRRFRRVVSRVTRGSKDAAATAGAA